MTSQHEAFGIQEDGTFLVPKQPFWLTRAEYDSMDARAQEDWLGSAVGWVLSIEGLSDHARSWIRATAGKQIVDLPDGSIAVRDWPAPK